MTNANCFTTALLDTVKAYPGHLHGSDTEWMIVCFEEDGQVNSPFLGTMRARDLLKHVAEAARGSVIKWSEFFASAQADDGHSVRIADYFRYDWTLSLGHVVTFTCMNVFTFEADSARIREMKLSHPLRVDVGDMCAND